MLTPHQNDSVMELPTEMAGPLPSREKKPHNTSLTPSFPDWQCHLHQGGLPIEQMKAHSAHGRAEQWNADPVTCRALILPGSPRG